MPQNRGREIDERMHNNKNHDNQEKYDDRDLETAIH